MTLNAIYTLLASEMLSLAWASPLNSRLDILPDLMTSFSTIPLLTHPIPAMQASLLFLVMLIALLPGDLRMWTGLLTGMLSGDTCWGPWPCFLQVSVQERPSLPVQSPKSLFTCLALLFSTCHHGICHVFAHYSFFARRERQAAELCRNLCSTLSPMQGVE